MPGSVAGDRRVRRDLGEHDVGEISMGIFGLLQRRELDRFVRGRGHERRSICVGSGRLALARVPRPRGVVAPSAPGELEGSEDRNRGRIGLKPWPFRFSDGLGWNRAESPASARFAFKV